MPPEHSEASSALQAKGTDLLCSQSRHHRRVALAGQTIYHPPAREVAQKLGGAICESTPLAAAHKLRTGTVAVPLDTHLKHNSIMSQPAAERTLWLLEARGPLVKIELRDGSHHDGRLRQARPASQVLELKNQDDVGRQLTP